MVLPTDDEIKLQAEKTAAEVKKKQEEEEAAVIKEDDEEFDDAEGDKDEDEEEEEEEAIPLQDMRVTDLRFALRRRALPTQGVKAILIERLSKALEEEKQDKQDKPKDPDKIDPSLEDLEKKITLAKVQRERKEMQLNTIATQLKQENESMKLLQEEKKKKLLLIPSPANTEDFRKKILSDIDKKRAKKKLFQDNTPNDPPKDDDNRSQGSKYKISMYYILLFQNLYCFKKYSLT